MNDQETTNGTSLEQRKQSIRHALRTEVIDDETPELSNEEPIEDEFTDFREEGGTLEDFLKLMAAACTEYGYSSAVLDFLTKELTEVDTREAVGELIEAEAAELGGRLEEDIKKIIERYQAHVDQGHIAPMSVIFHIHEGLGLVQLDYLQFQAKFLGQKDEGLVEEGE